MVEAGLYTENVRLPNAGGTVDAPLQLISADGIGAATIVGATAADAVIKGLGSDNVVVEGFTVKGGANGIQFSQNASAITNYFNKVMVADNIVSGSAGDGIKIDQAFNVSIVRNVVSGNAGQDVDFVAVNNSVIAYNDLSHAGASSTIFVKGGSSNDLVQGNLIHDSATDGIEVGGYSTASA